MKKVYLFIFTFVFYTGLSYAEDELNTLIITPSIELNKINDTDFISGSGKTIISEKDLESLPTNNGDMNEILKILPSVTFTSDSQSSEKAGEIRPGKLSINGAKSYENNFLIDGISNNSLLDPNETNSFNANNVEGHPQEIFLNTDILRSIDIYTSNVPAEYGQFTGGVIDAKTKRAEFNFSGKVSARYTSDKFTQFHIDNETDFDFSENVSRLQPQFEKISYDLLLNSKITEDTAFYINLARRTSNIPFLYFGETENETRKSATNYIKLTHYFNDKQILDVSYMDSPYESKQFLPTVKDSNFTTKGGGKKLIVDLESNLNNGKLLTKFSYGESQNSKKSPNNFYSWAVTKNKPWGLYNDSSYSAEGGHGSLKKLQKTAFLKSDFKFKPLNIINTQHQFKTGLEIQHIYALKHRPTDYHGYKTFKGQHALTNLRCNGAESCIERDQFASYRTTKEASKKEASINNMYLYFQDSFKVKQLYTRLGLRYDYNDFLNNHDISFRSFAKLDITNQKKYFISAGLNRYYSNNLLSYKLKQAGTDYYTSYRSSTNTIIDGQKVITPDDWSISSRAIGYQNIHKNIKTPHKDELSIGIETKLPLGNFNLEYIYREGNNEFTRYKSPILDDGYFYYYLLNDGTSKFSSVTFSWDKTWQKHKLNFNFRRTLESQTNHKDYDDSADEYSSETEIFYNGQVRNLSDFSNTSAIPDTAKLSYSYSPTDTLNIGIFTNYKPKKKLFVKLRELTIYTEINSDKDNNKEYRRLPTYYHQTQEESLTFNLRASYLQKTTIGDIKLTVDINNVFDHIIPIENGKNEYLLGRQFWLGLSYAWD